MQNTLTLCHFFGLPAHAGLDLISISVSHSGLAIARKMQFAMIMANTARENHGFSTMMSTVFLIGFDLASTQKAKSLCCACINSSPLTLLKARCSLACTLCDLKVAEGI